MVDKVKNSERRKVDRRSRENMGPPAGCTERRINIERRLFNIEVFSLHDWLQAPRAEEKQGGQ